MFLRINHRTEKFMEENFKSFTEEEFIQHVHSIAKSAGVNELPEIYVYKESEGEIGVCFSQQAFGKTHILALGFHAKLRDGKSYSIYQVEETIKHELAHLIANLRYNDDCGHDERFMTVVREIGGEPSEVVSLGNVNLKFHFEKRIEKNQQHLFTLTCSSCRKIHYETNDYKVFELFVLSGSDSPYLPFITWGELNAKSACCDSLYSFEGSAENLLAGLEKDDQVASFRETLKGLITESPANHSEA